MAGTFDTHYCNIFLFESRPVKVVKLSWFQVYESGANEAWVKFFMKVLETHCLTQFLNSTVFCLIPADQFCNIEQLTNIY